MIAFLRDHEWYPNGPETAWQKAFRLCDIRLCDSGGIAADTYPRTPDLLRNEPAFAASENAVIFLHAKTEQEKSLWKRALQNGEISPCVLVLISTVGHPRIKESDRLRACPFAPAEFRRSCPRVKKFLDALSI